MMDIQEAKDKLYYELLYTVREYGGTEEDLLELVDSFSYLDGKAPMFMNPKRENYSIEQFLNEQKPVLETYLDNLGVPYEKEVSSDYVKYKVFNDNIIIEPYEDKYNVEIKINENNSSTLLLSFPSVIDIVIDNKYRF